MTQTLTQKSMLARLLAKENIAVVQGNYPTAFFDVENRVLGLPYFKEGMSKDLLDLLMGHEVGHALHTPADGWHNCDKEIPGVPKAFVNIVEDIRIERKILSEFPGLLGGFKRGYKELLDRDFFGINDKDVNLLSFMDRLNLFSKSRGLVPVEFSEEEEPFVKKAMGVQTFEDVTAVCAEIAAWLGEKSESQSEDMVEEIVSISISMPGMPGEEGEGETGDGQNGETVEMEMPKQESSSGNSSDEGDKGEEEGKGSDEGEGEEKGADDSAGDGKESSEEESDKESNTAGSGAGRTQNNLMSTETDDAFRKNEESLVDNVTSGGQRLYVKGMSRAMFDATLIPFARVKQERAAFPGYASFDEEKYAKWMTEAKVQVNQLVKEFEMRKAAYRTLRARTSNKGSLDVTKLHKYKYDDQLFKQVTHLADAKNHGMLMFIDMSGSMHRQIESVGKQTIILSMFCKRVGIPFEVYGFTNSAGKQYGHATEIFRSLKTTEVKTYDTQVVEFMSSKMTKGDFESASRWLFNVWRQVQWSTNMYDSMRGTPLYETMMSAHYIASDFQKKYNVQKLNITFLTDGAGDSIEYSRGNDIPEETRTYGAKHFLDFWGDTAEIEMRWNKLQPLQQFLLNSLRKNFGATVINYFITANSQDFRGEIARSTGKWGEVTQIANAARKMGAFIIDNNEGYDRKIVLEARGDVLRWRDDEDYEIEENMTAAQIAKNFGKHATGRKKQRFICQKFAELVA